jgi:four helix bundle protein
MKTHEYSFERLTVWQKARQLVKKVYKVTQYFPDEEKYGLSSQIRRAATSIPSNLAEGSSRETSKDRAHFTRMAYTSLMELLNQIILSYDLAYLDEKDYLECRNSITEIGKMLTALQKAQLKG